MRRHGKSVLMALALAALAGPAFAGRHIDAAIVDEGCRRTSPPRQDPRNREQRRTDAALAKKRKKEQRRSNAGAGARRIRGKA